MPRSLIRATAVTIGSLFILAAAVRAQAPVSASAAPNAAATSGMPDLPPNALALRPKVDLTLQQAVALALDKNFDIQLQKYSLLNSQESLLQSKAGFDPNISASMSRSEQKSTDPITGTVTYSPQNFSVPSLQVSQTLPTGGSVSLGLTPFSRSGNPASYSTGYSFGFNHNLLRGFGRGIALAGIRNSQLSLDSANLSYRGRVMDTVQSVENAFTSLIAANDTYQVRLRSEQISLAQKRESDIRLVAGLLTELDVSQTEQQLLSATNSRIQAELQVEAAEDTLRNLLGAGTQQSFDVAIDTGKVDDLDMPTPTVEAAFKLTLENSTQYQSQLISIKQSEISLISTRSNTLPQLNFSSSVGSTARGSSIDSSWTTTRERDNTSWSVGLSFSMAWGLHAEKSRLRAALNSLESSRLSLTQLEQSLLIQIRTAVRTLETARNSLKLSQLSYDLAIKNYDSGNEKYKVGQQTQLALLQLQQSVESAGVSLSQARFSLRSAITSLQRLEGTTLDRYGIKLPDAQGGMTKK